MHCNAGVEEATTAREYDEYDGLDARRRTARWTRRIPQERMLLRWRTSHVLTCTQCYLEPSFA